MPYWQEGRKIKGEVEKQTGNAGGGKCTLVKGWELDIVLTKIRS